MKAAKRTCHPGAAVPESEDGGDGGAPDRSAIVLDIPQQPGAIPNTDTYFDLMDYLVKTLATGLQEREMNPMDFQVVWEVMKWPLAACLVLPPLLVYLGLHVVKREVIFVDLALAQVATLGTCVALLLGYHFDDRITFWISLGVTFLGAALFSWSRTRRRGQVPQEAIIGITFVVAAAGVILLLSRVAGGKEELEHLLTGDILNVT